MHGGPLAKPMTIGGSGDDDGGDGEGNCGGSGDDDGGDGA